MNETEKQRLLKAEIDVKRIYPPAKERLTDTKGTPEQDALFRKPTNKGEKK